MHITKEAKQYTFPVVGLIEMENQFVKLHVTSNNFDGKTIIGDVLFYKSILPRA